MRALLPVILARLRSAFDAYRTRLASVDALPQLALLAVVAGALTALVSLLFRGAIELLTAAFLPGGESDNFEGLSEQWRFWLPVAGAFAVGLALQAMQPEDRRAGVAHVMERLSRHQGRMRWPNALVQFFGGIVALTTGASGGREGPAIHLGASASSLLGRSLGLPNNSIRMLVGCGTAAAVASAFNTPIAGVILATEVVMMEYAVSSFIPAIVAAVTATLFLRATYGAAPAFDVPPVALGSLLEIPYILAAGVICGGVAVLFTRCVGFFASWSRVPVFARCTLAGVITGAAAIVAPAVMGVGYDTIDAALASQLAIGVLFLALVLKIFATSACVGFGLPVGLIGPAFMTGALLGALLGEGAHAVAPITVPSVGLYVMLGMAAMMAAMLQAPLAALMAVLELTANPHIVLPAMLIIVVATMTASHGFAERSVFAMLLARLGLSYDVNPVTQHLQRAGVAGLMQRKFVCMAQSIDATTARNVTAGGERWVLIESGTHEVRSILNTTDLRCFLEADGAPAEGEIDLMRVPGLHENVVMIHDKATVHEALDVFDRTGAQVLCVHRSASSGAAGVVGILPRADVERYARFG